MPPTQLLPVMTAVLVQFVMVLLLAATPMMPPTSSLPGAYTAEVLLQLRTLLLLLSPPAMPPAAPDIPTTEPLLMQPSMLLP